MIRKVKEKVEKIKDSLEKIKTLIEEQISYFQENEDFFRIYFSERGVHWTIKNKTLQLDLEEVINQAPKTNEELKIKEKEVNMVLQQRSC